MYEGITIRNARHSDVAKLLHLEKKCWKPHLQSDETYIAARIARCGSLQWVAEQDHEIVGALYTQRIASIDFISNGSFRTQLDMHIDKGRVAQLCSINVNRSTVVDKVCF